MVEDVILFAVVGFVAQMIDGSGIHRSAFGSPQIRPGAGIQNHGRADDHG